MGTPDFAVASLRALVESGHNIVGVVTAPDKPAGRGMKMTGSAVRDYALGRNLAILQPQKLKDPFFIDALRSLKADLQVVVAFRMLPEIVWTMPPMGTVNLHGSLLPQYRGAAPINWAIINGEKETGVTTFKLKHEIDTGNILLQERISIAETETASELHDRMKHIGASLLVKTVDGLADGILSEKPQSEFVEKQIPNNPSNTPISILYHAPKIFTETCRINWDKNVDDVYNLIRGLSSYPGAYTHIEGKMLKIFRAEKGKTDKQTAPGKYTTDKKTTLQIDCANGFISVKELQLEGKKKMGVEDFLRGHYQLFGS